MEEDERNKLGISQYYLWRYVGTRARFLFIYARRVYTGLYTLYYYSGHTNRGKTEKNYKIYHARV